MNIRMLKVLFALLLLAPVVTAADQFNDLYYIDPGGAPDLTEEGKASSAGPAGTGSGSAGGGSTVGGSTSGAGAISSPGTGGADGDSNSGSGVASGAGAIAALLAGGAVTGEGAAGGGGATTDDGAGGVAGGGGSAFGGSVSIDGKKVRAAVRADSDISAVLRYWKLGTSKKGAASGRLNPFEHYALIAATLASEDEQLESASFSGGRFEMVYRSRGALFWFIPMSFPVRLSVAVGASAKAEVRLPWYRFFVNEYFTPASLAGEVEAVVNAELGKNIAGEDIQGQLFETVARFLRQKTQTIQSSIFLK